MNPLQELLEGEEGLLDLDRVREATAAAVHELRYDRRVERLTGDQAFPLGAQSPSVDNQDLYDEALAHVR